MRRRAIALLVLASLAGAPGVARGDDPPATIEAAKERIAALDVDGARKIVARLRAASKDPQSQKEAKDLDREIAIAKKIEPVLRKLLKLLDDGKAREAYALGLAAADEFPGAVALAALRPRMREARAIAFLVVDDFDLTPAEKPGESAESKWKVVDSKVAFVPDPAGGRALRWTCDTGTRKQTAQRKLPAQVDLGDFESVSLRIRAEKAPVDTVYVRFLDNAEGRTVYRLTVRGDGAWHEVRLPLGAFEAKGGFDPARVLIFDLHYQGPPTAEIEVDEILLARRG